MNKTIEISKDVKLSDDKKLYLYRVASFSVDKVTLEKHCVAVKDTFDRSSYVAEINEDTKVGSITQKVDSSLVPFIIKSVDTVIADFEANEKLILNVTLAYIEPVIPVTRTHANIFKLLNKVAPDKLENEIQKINVFDIV